MIVFHELHAIRLARAYIAYFHDDRTHLGLERAALPWPGPHRGCTEERIVHRLGFSRSNCHADEADLVQGRASSDNPAGG